MVVSEPIIDPFQPLWARVEVTIPSGFIHRRDLVGKPPPGNHNGASSPFKIFYPLLYDDKTIRDIDDASYIHDWGYTFARLLGSPWAHLDRKDWDGIYRDWYIDHNHSRIAFIHYHSLRIGGGGAWRRNAELMKKWGYFTYDDYLLKNENLTNAVDSI